MQLEGGLCGYHGIIKDDMLGRLQKVLLQEYTNAIKASAYRAQAAKSKLIVGYNLES